LSAAGISSSQWQRTLTAYAEPDTLRSAAQLAGNLIAFFGLWVAMWQAAESSYWGSLLLAIPTAGFVLRLFSIQHDCGHGAFFNSRAANDWTGRALSLISLVPYAYWRSAHANHHAAIGRLDKRGIGEIDLFTAREFSELSPFERTAYRVYRHPLGLLGIGPSWQFYLRFRLPFNLPEPQGEARRSILATNAALLAALLTIHATLGLGGFLALYLPAMTLAAGVGVALFYMHHNFERGYWAEPPEWRHRDASLQGSSYLALPRVLEWFTGHTGIHHVHHLCPRIPNYRLRECIDSHPELAALNRLALRDAIRCFRLGLWDEGARKLISFREAKPLVRAQLE
jgi:omega-6 fatty acid desaturase (delta-12 desaturase)